ncbi:hypothetical protein [Rhodanobacter koreensis]
MELFQGGREGNHGGDGLGWVKLVASIVTPNDSPRQPFNRASGHAFWDTQNHFLSDALGANINNLDCTNLHDLMQKMENKSLIYNDIGHLCGAPVLCVLDVIRVLR